jgi:hypothetical protein
MAINVTSTTAIHQPAPATTDAGTPNAGTVTAATTVANAKVQLNTAIVEASVSVSISAKNQPLALLFKSAIESLNQILKPEFGDDAIQNAVNQDNTPAGTAGRIVSLSTGLFEAYKRQHPGEDGADVLKKFMATIRSGFEQGFNEAKNILQGLSVLNGDIAGNIEKTYDMVLQGYADFEAANSGQASAVSAKAA